MSKIIEYFKPVDPFIEYTPKERSYDLLVLHFNVSILSIIGFIIYSIVNVLIFAMSPEPSELTITNIFTNQTTDPIFQLGISVPDTGYSCSSANVNYPFDNQITKNPQQFLISVTTDSGSSVVYSGWKFPIYGTVDAKSGTSFVVLFNPCTSSQTPTPKLPYSIGLVNDPSVTVNKFTASSSSSGSIKLSSSQAAISNLLFYPPSNFDLSVSVEMSVIKTVQSNNKISYNAQFVGPVRFIPDPILTSLSGLKIIVEVNPTVTVLTYKPKNVLTLIGSIGGTFPLFILMGNIISGRIYAFMNRNREKQVSMDEQAVLNYKISFNILSINIVSSLFNPPPAKCPQTPGIIMSLEFSINLSSS